MKYLQYDVIKLYLYSQTFIKQIMNNLNNLMPPKRYFNNYLSCFSKTGKY